MVHSVRPRHRKESEVLLGRRIYDSLKTMIELYQVKKFGLRVRKKSFAVLSLVLLATVNLLSQSIGHINFSAVRLCPSVYLSACHLFIVNNYFFSQTP